jgi:hypothetical protein
MSVLFFVVIAGLQADRTTYSDILNIVFTTVVFIMQLSCSHMLVQDYTQDSSHTVLAMAVILTVLCESHNLSTSKV